MSRTATATALFIALSLAATAFAGPAAAGGQTVAVNGVEIFFETAGEGEPLVLLHGFMQSHHSYTPFVETLAETYRLIMPDLRGHGGSTNPDGVFTMRQSAEDILALLDHLGIDRFRGIGISAGAMTLLHIAAAHPERVAGLVLVGSGTCYSADCRGDLVKMGTADYPEASMERMRRIHTRGDEQIRALLAQLASLADTYEDVNFTAPWLSRITAPTLLVQGDRDDCFPVSMIGDMYGAIPNAWLWVIPNGGHVPIYGAWAPVFGETVKTFFSGGWEQP